METTPATQQRRQSSRSHFDWEGMGRAQFAANRFFHLLEAGALGLRFKSHQVTYTRPTPEVEPQGRE